MKKILFLMGCILLASVAAWADETVDKEVALLRSDINTQKIQLITANMNFTAEEASVFWPVYKKYEDELSKIGDVRVAMLKDYAANYDTLTNEKAKELTQKWFKTEEDRLQLKKKYFEEFQKVLPAKTAARFIQVENRLNMLLDLQLTSGIPLVTK